MVYKRIKDIREDNDCTQEYVAEKLNVNRSTYANWENGDNLIPLDKLDEISILFNIPLSYLLGIDKKLDKNIKVKPINYQIFFNNLKKFKKEKKHTYQEIGDALGVFKTTAYKYYSGERHIPVDKLVVLANFYSCNIDELLGKL